MSTGATHAPALGPASFRELLWPIKRARGATRNQVRPERKSLRQLLASERWSPTRRTSPELAEVLGFEPSLVKPAASSRRKRVETRTEREPTSAR